MYIKEVFVECPGVVIIVHKSSTYTTNNISASNYWVLIAC